MENPIKMDDLGVPLFSETSIYDIIIYIHTRIQQHVSTSQDSTLPINLHRGLAQVESWRTLGTLVASAFGTFETAPFMFWVQRIPEEKIVVIFVYI